MSGLRSLRLLGLSAAVSLGVFSYSGLAAASPFGQGVFGADVPFGAVTSLAVNLGSDISLSLSPDSSTTLRANASHAITVTSTDVVGYKIYARALSSADLVSTSASIAASANNTPGSLALNSWGYNTDGSNNFLGMATQNALIKDADGPHKNGDTTTVYYGVYTDNTKDAGSYQTSVVYTVVAENQ